jgi:dihydrofolate reductase
MKINMILAKNQNGVIGKDNTLPWHLLEDMKRFKELTDGQIVVMGKNTWESLPDRFKPLPNRKNIVISTSLKDIPNEVTVCSSIIETIDEIVKYPDKEIWIIGGASIYKQFEVLASRIELTVIKQDFEGDCFIHTFSKAWKLQSQTETLISKTGLPYSFETYIK